MGAPYLGPLEYVYCLCLDLPHHQLYAYDACQTRPESSRHFAQIVNWIDHELIPELNAEVGPVPEANDEDC